MNHDPFDFSGGDALVTNDHGPRPVERLQPGEYSPQFLQELRELHTVFEAPQDWDGNRSALPPSTTWVLHSNAELERVGFGTSAA